MSLGSTSPIWLVAYQGVWLVTALGAASGTPWPGVAAAASLIAARLLTAPPGPILAAVALFGCAGALAETAIVTTGAVLYAAPWPSPSLAPIWLIGLWMGFGATLDGLRHLLGRLPWPLLALLGAVVGPLAYLAGARVGALSLAEPWWLGLAPFAALWAIALPLAVALRPATPPG